MEGEADNFSRGAALAAAAALLLPAGCQRAGEQAAAPQPVPPALRIQPVGHGVQMPPGYGIAFEGADELFWNGYDSTSHAYVPGRWNASGERFEPFPVPAGMAVESAAAWEHGGFLLGRDTQRQSIVVHVTRERSGRPGAVATTPLAAPRTGARLLALRDGTALVVGGLLAGTVRTRSAERVRLRGKELTVTPAAEMPGPAKGVAFVALGDGRAMALGGTDEAYLDCGACSAAVRIYDPAADAWTAGADMLQPRAHATATLLPDGSVLVAGGWSPGFGWQTTANAATERWNPRTRAFEAAAPMPVGMSGHQAAWGTGFGKRVLLLTGGFHKAWEGAKATLAYDVASGSWRTAGEHCPGEYQGGTVVAGSLNLRDRLLQWCPDGKNTIALPLRWPQPAPVEAQGGFGPARGAAAFVPAGTERPALLVGGAYEGGVPTAAVDAMTKDGQVQAHAPLNHARFAAMAFALKAGTVVAGGQPYHRGHPEEPRTPLPMEWLPADPQMRGWRATAVKFGHDDVVVQVGDSSLLALRGDGSLERLDLTARGGELAIARVPLAPPPGVRKAEPDRARVALRQLDDGRIVVAGGVLQTDAIALFGPQAVTADAPDLYVPDGPLTPWTDYDIFDPATRRWLRSAPAGTPGGVALIRADGRVLKLTFDEFGPEQAEDGSWPVAKAGALEISSPDGSQWLPFASPAPLIRLDDATRLFELDGVLFISGQDPRLRTASPRRLLALDPADGAWKLLWEAPPRTNWRALQGRAVTVTLAGGRRAVVPLEGP